MKFSILSKLIAWFKKIFSIYQRRESPAEIRQEERESEPSGVTKKEPIKVEKTTSTISEKIEGEEKIEKVNHKIATSDREEILREKAYQEKQVDAAGEKEGVEREEEEAHKQIVEMPGKDKGRVGTGGTILEGIEKEKEAKKELIDKKEEGYRQEKEKQEVKKRDEEKVTKEEERKRKKGKPYRKKPPTELAKGRKETIGEKQKTSPSRRKSVDLGKRRQTKRTERPDISKTTLQEKREGKPPESSTSTRAMAPFVEVDLDEAKVFLVIPKQSFRPTPEGIHQKQLYYQVKLNNEEKTFQVSITQKGEYWEVAEKRIELEKPIHNFEVIFPSELGNRTYCYKHQNDFIYVFIAVGNNLGRMHYLYDRDGNINSPPQKDIWILLKEDSELGIEPDVIEDTWIWENYRPLCVNLKNKSKIVLKDSNTNEEKVIPCESTFTIYSGEVVYDDFGEQSPIFVGNGIEIKAPRMNEEGWKVWIQNKHVGYKIVSDNWSGEEPLELKLDHDLPCECGEFQVDICEQNGDTVTTLFFRYIPFLRLNYPKELIIPDSKKGHGIEKIEVLLQDPESWEIETSQQVKSISYGYKIDMPSEKDSLRFSISKKDKPETKTNFEITIPRLKWRTSRQTNWADNPIYLKREELVSGEDFYLLINTNNFSKYVISAVLESNGQRLQESKLVRKGKIYNLLLNQFYDTLREVKSRGVIKLWGVTSFGDIEVVNILPPELVCRFCDFSTCDKEEMINHIKEQHLFKFFEFLTFEELRKYDSSLPYKIYKCSYCGYYVSEDDSRNPTSSICNHIEKDCPKIDRSKGPPKVMFRVINDIDEIRKNVLPDLPNYRKCKLCGENIITSDEEKLLEHLIKVHEDEIYMVGGGLKNAGRSN